jgi:hypothetical protein
VHYRESTTAHPALDAWTEGREFVFTEPEVSTASLAG